jgi:uncharacterized DUF497 family protein
MGCSQGSRESEEAWIDVFKRHLRFRDPDIFTIYDEQHSELEEDRWISIGLTEKGLVCVVTHTYRKENGIEAVRIISARKAGGTEEKQYFSLKGR